MTPLQAIEIAKKYYKHVELRREAAHKGDKETTQYHIGCMNMTQEIFDETGDTHGFSSCKHALECEAAICRMIRMIMTPDDISQYYNCPVCQQNTVVVRPKLIKDKPMVETACTGCGHLLSTEER